MSTHAKNEQQHAMDNERRVCNDCKRELPWWGVDEAGRCGRCYESMNVTRERRRAESAEASLAQMREALETIHARLRMLDLPLGERVTDAYRMAEAVLHGRDPEKG